MKPSNWGGTMKLKVPDRVSLPPSEVIVSDRTTVPFICAGIASATISPTENGPALPLPVAATVHGMLMLVLGAAVEGTGPPLVTLRSMPIGGGPLMRVKVMTVPGGMSRNVHALPHVYMFPSKPFCP